MDVLVSIILVGIVYFLVRSYKQDTPKQKCIGHTWLWRKQPDQDDEYMICTKCNKTPSEAANEV